MPFSLLPHLPPPNPVQVSESGKALMDVLQRSPPSDAEEAAAKPDFTAATHGIMGVLHQIMQVRPHQAPQPHQLATATVMFVLLVGSPRGGGGVAAPQASPSPAPAAVCVPAGRQTGSSSITQALQHASSYFLSYCNNSLLFLSLSVFVCVSGAGLGGAAWRGLPQQAHRCGQIAA